MARSRLNAQNVDRLHRGRKQSSSLLAEARRPIEGLRRGNQ